MYKNVNQLVCIQIEYAVQSRRFRDPIMHKAIVFLNLMEITMTIVQFDCTFQCMHQLRAQKSATSHNFEVRLDSAVAGSDRDPQSKEDGRKQSKNAQLLNILPVIHVGHTVVLLIKLYSPIPMMGQTFLQSKYLLQKLKKHQNFNNYCLLPSNQLLPRVVVEWSSQAKESLGVADPTHILRSSLII